LAAVAVKYPAFRELGTEVLAISVDSVDSHREWQEKELSQMVRGGALFPMLSDPKGKIGTLYGVYDQDKGMDARGRFLIDPRGIVQAIEVLPEPAGRNIAEILRQLRALQHHQATGEFMPCGWEPGKPTLSRETGETRRFGNIWKIWKTRHAF
jgi:alkyl hydroperoxide reductase subunit AhpC